MISLRLVAWRTLLVSAALALVTTMVSMNIGGRREHRDETVSLQQAILRAEPGTLDGRSIYFPQFQNRILFPIVLAATVQLTGIEPRRAYVLLRILSAWLAFWLVMRAAERISGSPERATQTAALLAVALILTFNHPWEHPTDVLDIAVFAIAMPWTIERRYGRLMALAIVASTNRESSVFLSLLWGAVEWSKTGRSRLLLIQTIGLGLAATVTVMSLRFGMAGMRAVAGPDMPIGYTIASLRAFLRHPSPHDWPILMVAVLILCATAVWNRPINREQAAILAAGVLMALLSGIGGAAEELRVYLPTITVAVLAGAVLKTAAIDGNRVAIASPELWAPRLTSARPVATSTAHAPRGET